MRCAFCLTGKMGIVRNLTAGEIVGQVRVLLREPRCSRQRFNIVLMGMGEPLHNYDATMKALRILGDENGLAVAPTARDALDRRRAAGAGAARHRAVHAQPRHLAALDDRGSARSAGADQSQVRPAELLDACRQFPLKRRNRITFEYVMLNGVNDSPEDARRLVRLLHGIKGKVNLLPLNEAAGIPFERPSDARVNRFARDSGPARRDGVGAPLARPRHPRRMRSTDHGIDAAGNAWSKAGAAPAIASCACIEDSGIGD